MSKGVVRSILAIAGSVALVAAIGTPSQAAKPAPPASDQGVVIAADGVVQPDGSIFYATGPISATTTVVVPDESGKLPGGLSAKRGRAILKSDGPQALKDAMAATQIATLSLSDQTFVTGVCCTWTTFRHPSVIWGYNDAATAVYRSALSPGTEQWVCTKGWGHYRGYNGSQLGLWGKWYQTGCQRGSDFATWNRTEVPWGYTVDNPRMQFQSQHIHSVAIGYWGA